jgi:hypothetical protein
MTLPPVVQDSAEKKKKGKKKRTLREVRHGDSNFVHHAYKSFCDNFAPKLVATSVPKMLGR